MGNAHIKPHSRVRNKKQVHWKAAGSCFTKGPTQSLDDNDGLDRPTAPGKPELLPDSEGTPDLITLQWARPLNDGGSPITGYFVEHRRIGSPHWVRATPLPVPFSEITLSGLEPGWRYQFRVSAENAVGYSNPSDISEPITVTLHRSAVTGPKFTQDVTDTVALENEKCEFVAYFLGQPAPRICWFKDDFEIFSSRRIRILTEHDRSVLTIHQTSLSDEGEIKCTATNRAGHVTTKARLHVEAPPGVRLPRNYEDGLLFEIGEIIRLKVSVVGRPTPLVFWSHNGESIQNDDRHEIEYSDKTCTLKIADAERSDRGEYQIKAVNKLGTVAASFLVTITDKPSPPGKAQVVMTLGRSVTLSWSTPNDDGGSKIGNYIIEYYRLGWNVWLKAATTRQLSTRLGDLIEGSEYKFRIKAESPYGISEPSEESEVVFIPDAKRGLTQPPVKDTARSSPRQPRSVSSSRVEFAQTDNAPPVRPKRLKSKSQQQTPEASPMLPRKDVVSQMNRNIFDRASLARDLAYGSPEMKLLKRDEESFDDVAEDQQPVVYTVKIEPPRSPLEAVTVNVAEPPSKLVREHSATVTDSSEFMLVLYSEEGENDLFEENSVAPPMSLSAPELSNLEVLEFPPLRYSASSTELLHERTLMRFSEAAAEEELERRQTQEIPKIRINSQDSDDIVGLDRKHSLHRSLSQQRKWTQKRHSLKTPAELGTSMGAGTNLKRAPPLVNMKRQTFYSEQTTSEELTDQEFDAKDHRKLYTQASFERSPVSDTEEQVWKASYEESMSETDSDSNSEMERFKKEIHKRTKRVLVTNPEEDTYRPPGGLSGMVVMTNEPFEILNRRKDLPDPSFVPKPILKKTDSPLVSPAVSPPSSPIKTVRALSPRPDVVLERNRSKSLAVPELPPLLSSSGDESDENSKPRQRSLSLTIAQNLLLPTKKDSPKLKKKTQSNSALPSVTSVAEISGITAASIVIPKNLLDKKKVDDEARVVADHYDHIVKSVGQRRRSNPILDREELKKAAESLETPQEEGLSSKEQTPSKENLSQDSGYQSVSPSYRRSSFTDHYDTFPVFRSPIRKPFNDQIAATAPVRRPSIEIDPPPSKDKSPLRKESVSSQRRDSVSSPRRDSVSSPRRDSLTSPRKDSVSSLRRDSGAGFRRESGAGVSSGRRDSGTGVQLGNFAQHSGRRSSLTTPSGKRSGSKSPSKRGTSITRKGALSPSRNKGEDAAKDVRRSLSPTTGRRLMLREITTQTSGYLENYTPDEKRKQEELQRLAGRKVRTAVDWVMDLAMFAVACWLYVFENELLAIPVLLVMVYRQLKEEVKKRIPPWVVKKLQSKPNVD